MSDIPGIKWDDEASSSIKWDDGRSDTLDTAAIAGAGAVKSAEIAVSVEPTVTKCGTWLRFREPMRK